MKTKPKIYVAGPFSRGDTAENIRRAVETADALAEKGFVPFIPHLNHFWNLISPKAENFWIEWDNEFLVLCDAVYRIAGVSPGSDNEEKLAEKNGIPVFHSLEELYRFFETA